jgi:hypothetical protein
VGVTGAGYLLSPAQIPLIDLNANVIAPHGGQFIFGGSFVLSSPITPVVGNFVPGQSAVLDSTPEPGTFGLLGAAMLVMLTGRGRLRGRLS